MRCARLTLLLRSLLIRLLRRSLLIRRPRLRCTLPLLLPRTALRPLPPLLLFQPQHPLPKQYARTRTHIVWNGDPSPALKGLMALLAKAE